MREKKQPAEIQITPPTLDDWEKFKNLRLEALQNDPSVFGSSYEKEKDQPDDDWKAKLERTVGENPKEVLIFAKDGDKYIGMIGAFPKENSLWNIKAVYVNPSYRGQEISKKLIQRILEILDKRGAKVVELSVNTNAEAAVNVYKQFGFEIYHTEKDFTFGDGKQYDKYEMRRVKSNRIVKVIKKIIIVLCIVLAVLYILLQVIHSHFRLKYSRYETCREVNTNRLIIHRWSCEIGDCSSPYEGSYYDERGYNIEEVWDPGEANMRDKRMFPDANTVLHLQIKDCSPIPYWKVRTKSIGTLFRL